ncbi:MAG: hypothetical protein IIB63_09805 [Proteobacteria bacterium]|nr:hypothetical protein [Pseudomonadota bacterium]
MMVGSFLPRWLRVSKPGGLRFGESEAVMIRRLVLFRTDITRTAWFKNRGGPPEVTLPDNVSMRWLPCEEWRSTPEKLETAPETVAQRYQNGDRCLIALDNDSGQVIYHLWVSDVGAYTPWIFKFIDTRPGHLMVFDVWAHPDHRGGKLHWAGASMAAQEAQRLGRTGIYAGVEEHEFFLFAAKYAGFGLVLIVPHASIIGIKVFGLKMHFDGTPPPGLVAFSRKLRARYPAIYIEDDIAHGDEPAATDQSA